MEPESLSNLFKEKVVLVTGAAGSIGEHLIKKILEYEVKEVRAFDCDENGLFNLEMNERISSVLGRYRSIIGDVRDRFRVSEAMDGVSIAIHLAALKHVETCELEVLEATRTNVLGITNLIEAAISNNVSRFLNLSTDKAVYPIGVYGCTKLLAEHATVQANNSFRNRGTIFTVLRLGNVIGTRGSVFEIWKKQKERGEALTVTDERMIRFFCSMKEAIGFILLTIKHMEGGEIFVPCLRHERILDLARKHSSNIKVTGIRPGETLTHQLLTDEERERVKELEMSGDEGIFEHGMFRVIKP